MQGSTLLFVVVVVCSSASLILSFPLSGYNPRGKEKKISITPCSNISSSPSQLLQRFFKWKALHKIVKGKAAYEFVDTQHSIRCIIIHRAKIFTGLRKYFSTSFNLFWQQKGGVR